MRFLRGLLWFAFAVTLVAVAIYVTGNSEVADRLTSLFLTIQPWLPLSLNFDQFLVVLTVVSLLLAVLVLSGCTAIVVITGARLTMFRQRYLAEAAAAKQEVLHVKEQHQRQFEHLTTVGQTLAKRLDKRVLVQTIVAAASRATSVGQANTVASLWLLNFETDTLQFETGLYCDQALFAKAAFQPTESPFAAVISTEKPWLSPKVEAGLGLVKPEKFSQLGSTTGLLVVPLIIESAVLGVLVLFCHPDVLKGYDGQRAFYDGMWNELSLALAIALQGELAILDRLTGAHNREYFMKRFIQEIERANRFQFPLSLLMIDIDNFKAVNDTLGHPQGDAVLKIVAKLVKKEVRAIDLVGRYGGEEFIVLLPETGYGEEATSAAGALLVAERIRKAIDDEFHGLQKPLNLTVSVGLAVRRVPEDREQDHRELLRLADEQLYRAKTTGKNKVCVFMPEKAQEVP